MSPARNPAGRWLLLAAVLALLGGCVLQATWGYTHDDLSGHAEGSDDAFISFRYARNLVAGHGLVFNPGERVEGYTNLLYVLLLALPASLAGRAHLLAVSIAFNVLCLVAALLGLYAFSRERLGDFRAGMGALALGLCPSLWIAAASGLETPLVLALQVGLWMAVEGASEDRKPPVRRLIVLTALLGLARADGFIAPLVAALYLLLRGRRPAALAVAATALATLAALVAWRLSYYGWPLPNTYYAKVAGSLVDRLEIALPQFSRAVFSTGMLASVTALLLGILRMARQVSTEGRRPVFSLLSFPVFFAPAWVGYWMYVGGDVFYERFLLILFPLGIFVLLDLMRTTPRPGVSLVVALVIALQLLQLRTDPRYRYTRERYDRWVLLGRHLAASHPGATLATDAAGKIPYFSGLPTLDMLGLTDSRIAHGEPAQQPSLVIGHAKFDVDYVFSRRPKLITTWVQSDLDMKWGLERSRWKKEGYRLRFLVNSEPLPKEPNLLDVSGRTEEELWTLISAGYGYGVLERQRETPAAVPARDGAGTAGHSVISPAQVPPVDPADPPDPGHPADPPDPADPPPPGR